jgi:carbamoyltransferase
LTAILGLNAYHGDAAAALVVDGELVCAAEEERFNRVKHCAGFPAQSAAWCLEYGGLSAADLDHVAIGRDPKANLGAKLRRTLTHGTSPRFLRERLANADRVRDVTAELEAALGAEVGARDPPRRAPPSPRRERVLRIAVRRGGDSLGRRIRRLRLDDAGRGRGATITVLERVLFPHSLGIFYTAVTQWLGLPGLRGRGQGDGPGSVRHAALPWRDAAVVRRRATSSSSVSTSSGTTRKAWT